MLIVDSCGSYTDFIASPLVIYFLGSAHWDRRFAPTDVINSLNVYSLERLFSSRHEAAKIVFTHFDAEFRRRNLFLEKFVERVEERAWFIHRSAHSKVFGKKIFNKFPHFVSYLPESQHALSSLSLSFIHLPPSNSNLICALRQRESFASFCVVNFFSGTEFSIWIIAVDLECA